MIKTIVGVVFPEQNVYVQAQIVMKGWKKNLDHLHLYQRHLPEKRKS